MATFWGVVTTTAPVSQSLNKSQMYVAGSGRHVDEEIVKLAPVGLLDKLPERVGSHCPAPDGRTGWIDYKTDRQHLDTICLRWNYEIAAVDLMHVQLGGFKPEHLRQRRPEDIGVEQSYRITLGGECHGQIGGHSAFSHTALSAAHGNDVLHSGEHGCLLRSRHALAHDGIHSHIRTRSRPFHSGLGGL